MMKKVCRDCEHSKDRFNDSCYCKKYGIIIGYSKEYCVSYRPERGEEVEQVRSEEDGN